MPNRNILGQVSRPASGLDLLRNEVIGATVSSVTLTNVFSSNYRSYEVIVHGGVASTANQFRVTLGAANTAYYYTLMFSFWNTGLSAVNGFNTTRWDYCGTGTTDTLNAKFTLIGPFETKPTIITAMYVDTRASGSGGQGTQNGMLSNNTSYTDFTITASAGTFTGGNIYVYGYTQ